MTNTTNTAAASGAAILFEHDDGRYAINQNTTGDPAWHRLGPVDVSAIAAAPAQPVSPDGGSIVRLVEEKIAAMSPSEVAAFMTARAALAAPKGEPAAPDITDAYAGAQEDIAIWKKRALEAEALNHRFITDINGPTFVGEPTTSDDAFIAREFYESQEDSLLICASDLQNSAIYDNHVEMQSCLRAVADRISAIAAPAQPAQAQPSTTPKSDPLQPLVALQEKAGMYADDFAPQADSVPKAQFDDPKVQAVYAILCDDADWPPKENPQQHWEGWIARRIVDALLEDSVQEDAARLDFLQECGATVEVLPGRPGWTFRVGGLHGGVHRSVRAAIDADRKQVEKQ